MAQPRKYAIRNGFKSWAAKLTEAIADGEADVPYLLALQDEVQGILDLIVSAIGKRRTDASLLPFGGLPAGESMYQHFSEFRTLLLENLGDINEMFLSAVFGELRELLNVVTRELQSRGYADVGAVGGTIGLTRLGEYGNVGPGSAEKESLHEETNRIYPAQISGGSSRLS